ncbi:TetR-like C-terminal domain-containing protein [Nocardia sp. NPDC051787]|uniref:TetR-like C-terminal domain-containing protein n=1 Tax=Nocardia sp. NPDC051787 TaxID=3155415 RepID=UPI00342C3165
MRADAAAGGGDVSRRRGRADRVTVAPAVLADQQRTGECDQRGGQGKSAIVSAVAEQGFAEFTAVVRQAHAAATDDVDRLRRVARAYLEFAAANPALYDAMFLLTTDLSFGLEAPVLLREAFAELEATFRLLVDDPELGTRTEVAWSTLHGDARTRRPHPPRAAGPTPHPAYHGMACRHRRPFPMIVGR